MALSADTLLRSLQAAGLPVTGVSIRDETDPATWTFQPTTLTKDDLAQAVSVVQGVIAAANQGPIPVVVGPTLDQVIAWQAGKLAIPVAQARSEIALLPAVYVTPPVGTPPV